METIGTAWMWVAFGAFVLAATASDLRLLGAEGQGKVTPGQALGW